MRNETVKHLVVLTLDGLKILLDIEKTANNQVAVTAKLFKEIAVQSSHGNQHNTSRSESSNISKDGGFDLQKATFASP